MVMGMANLAMVTGNIGREGVGVNPLRGQNNVQGSCDMGSFPHEFPGYRHVSQDDVRGIYEELWGRTLDPEPGPADPQHVRLRAGRHVPRPLRPGRGHRPVRPQHPARRGRAAGDGPRRRPGPVPQRDRAVRPRLPARHVVPGEGRHLHQRRAPDQPGPPGLLLEGRHGRVGDHLRDRPGDGLRHVVRRRVGDHGRDRGDHPDVRGRLVRAARRARLDAVAGLRHRLDRDADHARRRVRARQGQAHRDGLRADDRAVDPQVPADPHDRPDPQPVQRRRPDAAYRQQHLAPRGRPRDPPRRRRGARHLHRRPGRPRPAGSARRRCAPRCRSGCRPASSTRPSTTR